MTKKIATFPTHFNFDPERVTAYAEAFKPIMAEHKIDTIAVRGTSGILVGSAMRMLIPDLHVFVVRKPNEGSHNGDRPIGTMGERWCFFDDFVDSGATFKAVYEAVKTAMEGDGWFLDPFRNLETGKRWAPKFVGLYEYRHEMFYDKRAIIRKQKERGARGRWGWDVMPEW